MVQNRGAQACGPLMFGPMWPPHSHRAHGDSRRVRRRVKGNKGSTTVHGPASSLPGAALLAEKTRATAVTRQLGHRPHRHLCP